MHENERDFVRPVRSESSPQERHATSVGSFDWFYLLARDVGGQDTGTRRQGYLEKRLRLVLDREFDLGEGLAFGGHQRGHSRLLRDRGQDARVRKARPLQRQGRLLVGLPVKPKRSLRREPRECAKIVIGFFHIHSLQASTFGGGQF